MKTARRSLFQRLFNPITRVTSLSIATETMAETTSLNHSLQEPNQDVPLYSGVTRQGNLLFVQGIGAHFDGDARAHADHILKEMENMLVKAGSSMQKVLKVNVYLHDINDYKVMNEVYKGRFGPKPPVRTTVSPRAGIPNGSLVEMDCIAYV